MTGRDDNNYNVPKRFREDDEPQHVRPKGGWTKSIIDLNNRKYLTRTPLNWLRLLIFYAIFMGSLAALCAVNVHVFLSNLDMDIPRVLMKQPGFSLTPCSMTSDTCVISYRQSNETEYIFYTNMINQTLQKYVDQDKGDRFGPCKWSGEYGYTKGMPCIFLKVNRIIAFRPKPIEKPVDLPDSAPFELDDYLTNLKQDHRKGKVWLSCETDNLDVNISYYPERFVRSDVVYLKQKIVKRPQYRKTIHEDGNQIALNADKMFYDGADLERIVAVQLTRFPKNSKVKLTCYLWALNIKRIKDGNMNHGKIHLPITIWP